MFTRLALALTFFVLGLIHPVSGSADWLTQSSTYTHDPVTAARVSQYAPIDPPSIVNQQPLRSSGYTHYRSTLAYGQSADNYHRVEEWGDPVRPYGEWRFPYRPYSTPYPNWGPPFGGLNLPLAIPFGGGYGPGRGGYGQGSGGYGPGSGGSPNPNRPQALNSRPVLPIPNPAAGTDGFSPYPSGRGTPYPVAPYYDGYYPNYQN